MNQKFIVFLYVYWYSFILYVYWSLVDTLDFAQIISTSILILANFRQMLHHPLRPINSRQSTQLRCWRYLDCSNKINSVPRTIPSGGKFQLINTMTGPPSCEKLASGIVAKLLPVLPLSMRFQNFANGWMFILNFCLHHISIRLADTYCCEVWKTKRFFFLSSMMFICLTAEHLQLHRYLRYRCRLGTVFIMQASDWLICNLAMNSSSYIATFAHSTLK